MYEYNSVLFLQFCCFHYEIYFIIIVIIIKVLQYHFCLFFLLVSITRLYKYYLNFQSLISNHIAIVQDGPR